MVNSNNLEVTIAIKCSKCINRICESSRNGDFDICDFGVSFANINGEIKKKINEWSVVNISRNLRHEINPILQTIIQQVTQIDNKLSTRSINTENPLSIVVGSVVLIDTFIQMMSGIHEFHIEKERMTTKKIILKSSVDYYFTIYSILKDSNRNSMLELNNRVLGDIKISLMSELINYMIAVFIDNAWKYSSPKTALTVNTYRCESNRINLIFTNYSKTIPEDFKLFAYGTKLDEDDKGFGFGLFWVKMLAHYYNSYTGQENAEGKLSISYSQNSSNSENVSIQRFTISNIIIDEK